MTLVRRTIVALLLVPPAFEGTVRLDDWARFGVPFSSGATNVMDLRIDDAMGRHARPSSAYRKFRINSLGFRGPEVTPEELRARPLVVVSGASESFGLYESEGREWPRQLADSLARRCGAGAPTVLNAALAGMSLPTVMQDLERRVLPLGPELVVYYPQAAQYLFEQVPHAAPVDRESGPLSPWRLRSYARLREEFKGMVPEALLDLNRRRQTVRLRAEGEALFPALPVERLDSLDAHLRSLVGIVRRGGSEIALVIPRHRLSDTTAVSEQRWLRAWELILPKATGALILSFTDSAEARIRTIASDSAVRLIDPPFPSGPERRSLFADPNHFTDRGAALMASTGNAVVAELLRCAR